MSDLSVECFKVLRKHFFNVDGSSTAFHLRNKKYTQDDPFDEYLCSVLTNNLDEAKCVQASGPLITPDLVIYRPDLCKQSKRVELKEDLTRIIAIEVKKLERTPDGQVARRSGLDYNTTPPCGIVRVYDTNDKSIDIRCFYLFVCLERAPQKKQQYIISAMVLCDGNVLNEDFDYYLKVTGQRTKRVGLGTYGNGADRQRPMLIFANPLGAKELDRKVTLIHPRGDLEKLCGDLRLTYVLQRRTTNCLKREFYCYRLTQDVQPDWRVTTLLDPFPTPKRVQQTQARGRFRLDLKLLD
jgi:hypothetical protein